MGLYPVVITGNVDKLVKILEAEGLDLMPKYVGFGHEVYDNKELGVQVIFDCQGGVAEGKITINKK